MWIFTKHAFLSIVAHRDNSSVLMVRARAEGDIQRVFPDAKVEETPDADYRYRANIMRGEVALMLASEVTGIGYDNFKQAVPERDRACSYSDCWHAMKTFQRARQTHEDSHIDTWA